MAAHSRLDLTDLRVLEELLAHPRITAVGLANQLGLARSTVQVRMAKLEEMGLLNSESGPSLANLTGFTVTSFLTLTAEQRDIELLRSGLTKIPEVIEAYGTTGDGDIHCRVVARSVEDLGRVNSLILGLPGAARSRTAVVIRPIIDFRILPLIKAARKELEN